MTSTADLLETIVAASRRTAEVRAARKPMAALEAGLARQPRGDRFASALRDSAAPRVIAECKRRSPSKGILRREYDPAAHAAAYAGAGAAAISVLTEPTFFDGSLDHLAQVRAAVDLPLLRKDFVVTEYQVVEAAAFGADAVLLIVGALSDRDLGTLMRRAAALRLAALVEVHDCGELDRALAAGARIVGVNSRSLRTLAVEPRILEELASSIPSSVVGVAESGISSPADISRLEGCGYRAFLVGERLITRPDPGLALRELRAR